MVFCFLGFGEKRAPTLSNNVPISGVNLKSPFSSNSNQIVRARPYISPSDRGISFIIWRALFGGRNILPAAKYKTFFFSALASSRIKIYSLSLRSVSRPVSRRKGVLIFDAACIEPNINFGRRRFFAAKNKLGGRARRTPRSSQKKERRRSRY